MPVCCGKIHPFLAPVFTGRAAEVVVYARECLIEKVDEVVLHGSLMLHVEVELAIHGFKLFSDFVHNTILFQVRPAVKSIFCDFDGVCLVRFHLAKGVRSEVLDQFGIHRSDEETGLCELTEQRLIVTACMFHNDARLAVNGLNGLNQGLNPTGCVLHFEGSFDEFPIGAENSNHAFTFGNINTYCIHN